MLGIILLFSCAVAVSLLWIFGFAFYVYAQIGFSNLFGLPLPQMTTLAAAAFLPVFAFWLVIALVHNVLVLKTQARTMDMLLAQSRRAADHAEAMVRTLLETQVQTKSTLALNNVSLFINELNDLLCDIVIRFGLVPPAHTEVIWQRIGDGNRWAFCKVILQNAENSKTFLTNLSEQLNRDKLLAQLVHQFCYRFEQMFTMLNRHDEEHLVTKIFEEGAMGRVYLRFVEASRHLQEQTSPDYEQVSPLNAIETAEREQTDVFDAADFYDAPMPAQEQSPQTAEETVSETKTVERDAPSAEAYEPAVPFGFLRPTR